MIDKVVVFKVVYIFLTDRTNLIFMCANQNRVDSRIMEVKSVS